MSDVLKAQCVKNVVVEERGADGSISTSELSKGLELKREIGNARLVSDDAMLWVAHGSMHSKPVADANTATSSSSNQQHHVTVTNGKRSFSFFLESNPDSDSFLHELRAQVDGKSGMEAKRKKRKIRKQIADNQSAGFVPVINSLRSPIRMPPPASPLRQPAAAPSPSPSPSPSPLTPTRRRLSDSTNSPRLAKPLPMTITSTVVSEARGVFPSPSKSPFRSPFRKSATPTQQPQQPQPRRASPIVSLGGSLPPKSPAVLFHPSSSSATTTPSPSTQTSAFSSSSSPSMPSPRPREWLSPARGSGGAMRVRAQLTPPSVRRDAARTPGTNGSRESRESSDKENTPMRSGGIVNKRVRSLARMLDDVPREEPEHTAGARPPTVRSPYFLSPTNAREMSPSRRPPSASKSIRSLPLPLGELQQNRSPVLPPSSSSSSPSLLRGHPTDSPMLATSLMTGQTMAAAAVAPRKVTHGLLNLGNYCYMNAIVQSLAALPGFADHLHNHEWLLELIQKRLATTKRGHAAEVQLSQLADLFAQWKTQDPSNRLVVQDKLAQLLQQVVDGSDSSINPEPLKAVMGRKNSRFASQLQQDAHEFLLQLVTEYEKELVQAVEGVAKAASAIAVATQSNSSDGTEGPTTPTTSTVTEPAAEPVVTAPKRASLYNFFRPGPSATVAAAPTETAAVSTKQLTPPSGNDDDDQETLVSELFPAECFRTELFRTLTCRSCQYSRRHVEKFYDFSLDLPYVAQPQSPAASNSPVASEPQSEPPLANANRQCHCGVDAVVIVSGDVQFYSCAKSACSLRDKVDTTTATTTTADSSAVESGASSPLAPEPAARVVSSSSSLQLADLLAEQFQSEVLELKCEKCAEGREAVARYEVKSLPRVLVFHLKRFEVNPLSGSLYKRCDLVEAPVELFPVQKIHGHEASAADSSAGELLRDARYTIKSVVHHLGKTIDQGHYVADVCGPRGDWRRRNDTHETLIGEDFALRASRSQESCYMLFYVLDTGAAAPTEEQEPDDKDNQDKENVAAEAPGSPVRTAPVATSSASTPTTVESPASLVGRRRELTPPRKDASTVSKSLHDLL